MNKVIALIDADIVAFSMSCIGEEVGEDGDKIIHSFTNVATGIDNRVEEILEAVESEHPIMYLTGDNNFRYKIATLKAYKANRKNEKPFHLENARMYIRSKYDTYISRGCEADDLLAMSMTQYRKEDVPCVLCTIDKDLLQVEGWHYKWETWNSGEVATRFITDFEGYLSFCNQIITGDATDNIPGLPRWGKKKADALFTEVTNKAEALQAVVSAFKKVYDEEAWEDALEEQARLVWMIRERDGKSFDGLKHWNLKENNYA